MGQQVQNAIATNAPNATLVRTCPISTPYALQGLALCSQCSDLSLFFNIRSRQCEPCPLNTIFNYLTHSCDFNVACPPGSQFN